MDLYGEEKETGSENSRGREGGLAYNTTSECTGGIHKIKM